MQRTPGREVGEARTDAQSVSHALGGNLFNSLRLCSRSLCLRITILRSTSPPQRSNGKRRLETIVAILQEQTEQQPVLFIVEDLHWTDPSTLELLNLVIDQTPTASLLVLLTCRPHFQPSWHHRSYLTEITVNRFINTPKWNQLVGRHDRWETFPAESASGRLLPRRMACHSLWKKSPKAILESGQLKALDGHYELVGSLVHIHYSCTLQDSLMARLIIWFSAKGIAQLAAVIGRQFPYAWLHAVLRNLTR